MVVLNSREIVAHLVEIHRQHDGLRAQLGGLHHAHGRAHAELPRRIGGGGDDAAADVVLEQREFGDRDETQRARSGSAQQRLVDLAPPAADHHRQALELRVAQQLDRRVKSVHVEVGDAAQGALWRRSVRQRGGRWGSRQGITWACSEAINSASGHAMNDWAGAVFELKVGHLGPQQLWRSTAVSKPIYQMLINDVLVTSRTDTPWLGCADCVSTGCRH